jgi:hypothetical protein
MLWDSKRSRIVVLSTTNQSGNFMITNLPNTPVESSVPPITGPLANSFGPKFGAGYAKVFGWAYDPVGDRYLYWGGGQTIYWVDPETWVSTAETPGGANPGTRTWIEAPVINGGYHIIYDSVLDVFMAVQTSADYEGIALYAPNRGAPQSCTSPISPRGRRPGIRIPRRARRRGRMG